MHFAFKIHRIIFFRKREKIVGFTSKFTPDAFAVRPSGIYLLDFFCAGIQFYLLLSPYLCFIFFLYLGLYFTYPSKMALRLWIFMVFSVLCLLCICTHLFFLCLVVTCWERVDPLAFVCGILLKVCHFPIGILGQVCYLIVSITDLCTLTYYGQVTLNTA